MAQTYSLLLDVKGEGKGDTLDEARANAKIAYEKALAERMHQGEKFLDERPGDWQTGPEERNRKAFKRKVRGGYEFKYEGEVVASSVNYS